MVTDQSDAATSAIAGLAALPPDIAEIIAEQALRASRAESPIEFETLPDGERFPMVDQTRRGDRDRVTIFSMTDGQPQEVLLKHRARLLRKRRTDGSPAFWAPGMPGRPPQAYQGTYICFLHPDSPEREIVDAAGYAGAACNDGDPSKKNRGDFRALSQKEQHERRKHPNAWEAVERLKAQRNQDEQLRLQREQIAAMTAIAGRAAEVPATAEEPAEAPAATARARKES